ncbi:MAG: PLP-dependent aminotransferase family protein [Actinobacteria bacterium]|nr:PLP-dependent aminotransferase family protein [Actinomycetota bacterium]
MNTFGARAGAARAAASAAAISRLDHVISFARGVPGPDCLPLEEIGDCTLAVLQRPERDAAQYGPPAGFPPLRELLAERHGVDPARVFVSNGSLQGLAFLWQRLLQGENKRVLVEAPTYDRPLKILQGLGAEVTGVPMDDGGLELDALERALDEGPKPAFLYTIPTFQNPSGRTLLLERRRQLVDLAEAEDLLIVEDDPYGLVRFEGDPLPSLLELAPAGRVIYSCSFSKTIAPGLRVGYLVLPPELAAAVEAIAVSTYVSPVIFTQAIVWEFLRTGLLEPNLQRAGGLLRERRDAMLGALEREFPDGASWSRPEGGYFIWLDLPGEVDAGALLSEAEAAGVTFVKGTDFFAGPGGESSARLAFSFAVPAEITDGVGLVAEALRKLLGRVAPLPATV